MAEIININKLFVTVPAGNEAAALTASTNTGNVKKIYFFAGCLLRVSLPVVQRLRLHSMPMPM